MSKGKGKRSYVPNPHYSQEDWDAVSDNPPLTDEELAAMRPAREVLPPEFFAALEKRRARGPQKAPTQKPESSDE